MSEEQKIPGVPEGWRLIHAARQVQPGEFYLDHSGSIQQNKQRDSTVYAFAVLERIPQTVLVAEWVVPRGAHYSNPRAVLISENSEGGSVINSNASPDRTRFEEREA